MTTYSAGIEVEYITMPGWKTSISAIRNFEDLPINAQNYVTKIEELLGIPFGWVGVGPERESMILRKWSDLESAINTFFKSICSVCSFDNRNVWFLGTLKIIWAFYGHTHFINVIDRIDSFDSSPRHIQYPSMKAENA